VMDAPKHRSSVLGASARGGLITVDDLQAGGFRKASTQSDRVPRDADCGGDIVRSTG
jgi:hypothetical protein